MYVGGVLFVLFSVFVDEGIGTGWTIYPSLVCVDFHSSVAVDFAIFALHLMGFSSILNSINTVGTAIAGRRKYMVIDKQFSCFIWGVFLTSLLLIVVLPILAGAVTMVLLDRNFNTAFYDIAGGGDLILFQHLFWFFGHPEVYIIILPVFGLISTMIEVVCIRIIFSLTAMIFSMISISCLGFFVWSHHMFTSGIDIDSRTYFGSITIVIGCPTSLKIFNWMYTSCCIDLLLFLDTYFLYMFVFMFFIGGITGLLLANCGLDILLHDTYFVVAHFHYVLSLGAVVGVLCGFLHFCFIWINFEFVLFFIRFVF